MKKPILAAMVLLLCLRFASPAFAQELEPSPQPTEATEPAAEPILEPSADPEADPIVEPEPDPTVESEPYPTVKSEPDPVAESESTPVAEPVILSDDTPAEPNDTVESVTEEPVYSFDVLWGDLAFTYSTGIWNPETLSYEASWSPATVTVTVTNTSTAPVVAAITPEGTNEYGIEVHVSPQDMELAVGGSGCFTVWLTGTPTEAFDSGEVATLTVSITPPPEP